MTLKPTMTQNQVRTKTITRTPNDKALALVAQLRLNCCQRLLEKMDQASPEGVVFANIIMEAKNSLQALRGCAPSQNL
jgi:hypothetical protein